LLFFWKPELLIMSEKHRDEVQIGATTSAFWK